MDPWLSSYEDLSDRYLRVPFRGIERKNFIRFETFRRMKILSPYGYCGVHRALLRNLKIKKSYPLKDSLCTHRVVASFLPFPSPNSSFFEDRESLSRNLKI